jgi:group II intron reverse transcriptase/maturase
MSSFGYYRRLIRFRASSRSSLKSRKGSFGDYVTRHIKDVNRVLMQSGNANTELIADLHNRVADYKTLRYAWWRLSTYGGCSPGPNHITFEDIQEPNLSDLLRELSVTIREGHYAPVPGRRVRISKGRGRGFRTLEVPNVEDRLVWKAIQLIIQPILENLFLPCSYGFRPNVNREDALAQALHISQREQRTIWVAEDIRDAFPSIPLNRIIDVVELYLPNQKLVNLIRRCLRTDENRHGLPQGGPLSPLLLNLYLHHFLDKRWGQRFPYIPLIRYADDPLLLCKDQQEAQDAYAGLFELLDPANMKLKHGTEAAIVNLRVQPSVDWLGYQVQYQPQSPQHFSVGFTSAAWEHLEAHLRLCHINSFAPLRAIKIIEGWLDQSGPCYQDQASASQTLQQIRAIAEALGFLEMPTPMALLDRWANAHDRWLTKTDRTNVVVAVNRRRGGQDDLFRDDEEGFWIE